LARGARHRRSSPELEFSVLAKSLTGRPLAIEAAAATAGELPGPNPQPPVRQRLQIEITNPLSIRWRN